MAFSKAQASMEFMLIFIILLIVLSVAIITNLEKITEITSAKTQKDIQSTLSKSATTINTVFLEGDGFSINLTLPETISGYDYEMLTDSNYLIIEFQNSTYSEKLLTANITGVFSKGTNKIKNEGGRILIS